MASNGLPTGKMVHQTSSPKVHFAAEEKLVNIVEFDDDQDSKKARECYWEVFARDRARFKDRVEQASEVLNPIFENEHRDRVLERQTRSQQIRPGSSDDRNAM